jgi:hypothetical protein
MASTDEASVVLVVNSVAMLWDDKKFDEAANFMAEVCWLP